MPFESGTATNLQDLLNKLGTFAAANGWTVHFSGARTGGAGSSGHALILSRGAVQGTLRSNNAAGSTSNPGPYLEALLWSGTYSAASTETQPNSSSASQTNWMAGPYVAYHAYTPSAGAARPYLHVVVEVQSGTFRHFGIGQLRRMGSFTNGAYVHGTNHNQDSANNFISDSTSPFHSQPFNGGNAQANSQTTIVRADFGGVSPRYCETGGGGAVGRLWGRYMAAPGTQFFGNFHMLASSGYSNFTGRAALLPLLCFVQADTTDQLIHPIGWPDDMRYVDVTNFAPGDTITLGSDTWRIFPVIRKGAARTGPSGIQNSWRYGYAYRQVP